MTEQLRHDPLGGMALTDAGFASLCAMVRDVADRHANSRLALFLEGGYDLAALGSSVRTCIEVLAGSSPQQLDGDGNARSDEIINLTRAIHSSTWPL